ncbi:MAG TPA: type II toxin-antitoxin system HicB family antitoxin [Vicinamibacteria bacterium]|nr:type II toxin-antitoxin system HicB family antitoxin [Vicinamibacteria bacterium]
MASEFTAVIERDGQWFIAYSPEVPGANGQGKSKEEALQNLSEAIALILEDRRADGLRGLPGDAILDKVTVK